MSDGETTAAVEFAIVVRCSDEFGGLLEADTEFDFSITPVEPVDSWEQEVESAIAGGAQPTEELLRSAETRTFRVTVPAGTPGEGGVARVLRTALAEALAGTGVSVTAFEGESVPGQDNEAMAKLVFEGVRAVDVVWAESKISGWLWARRGRSGSTGLGSSPLFRVPSTPRVPLKPPWWPPFAPPSLPTQPVPTGTPGSPRLRGWKIKKTTPKDAPPKMRRLEGGGDTAPPGGHWRRLALSFRLDPFASGVAAFPAAFRPDGDWRGFEFLMPPRATAPEEIAAVLTAWTEEQSGWPDLWQSCVTDVAVQLEGDDGGTSGRVHWQVELGPVGVSALLAAEDVHVEAGRLGGPSTHELAPGAPSTPMPGAVRVERAPELTSEGPMRSHSDPSSVPGLRPRNDRTVFRQVVAGRPHGACWLRIRNARLMRAHGSIRHAWWLLLLLGLCLGCGDRAGDRVAPMARAFLAGWAEPTGTADAASCPPRRIRRLQDGAEMRLIDGGSFRMGAIAGDQKAADDEKPRHAVELSAFYVDVTEVTTAQYELFVEQTGYVTDAERAGKGWVVALPAPDGRSGLEWRETEGVSWRRSTSSGHLPPQGGRHPVVLVSWRDAMAFARWVGCTLPTEAQFEFLLRAGRPDDLYPWGSTLPPPPRYGNFADESLRDSAPGVVGVWPAAMRGYEDGFSKTAPVGSFGRDRLGLFDISGNVWELCLDAFDEQFYRTSPPRDPVAGPHPRGAVDEVVRRGGAWMTGPGGRLRCSWRDKTFSDFCSDFMGFRCAKSVPAALVSSRQG